MEGYAIRSTSVQSWAPPLLFITLFVKRNLIGCPEIPGRLIMKAYKTRLNPPRDRWERANRTLGSRWWSRGWKWEESTLTATMTTTKTATNNEHNPVVLKKSIESFQWVFFFTTSLLSPLGKEYGLWFEQIWILFTTLCQDWLILAQCFWKKIFESVQYIFTFRQLPLLD